MAGLADGPRAGRHRLGSPRVGQGLTALRRQPRARTVPRLQGRLRWPYSGRTLRRRVQAVAAWRRPRLVADRPPRQQRRLHPLLGVPGRGRSPSPGAGSGARPGHHPLPPSGPGPVTLPPPTPALLQRPLLPSCQPGGAHPGHAQAPLGQLAAAHHGRPIHPGRNLLPAADARANAVHRCARECSLVPQALRTELMASCLEMTGSGPPMP